MFSEIFLKFSENQNSFKRIMNLLLIRLRVLAYSKSAITFKILNNLRPMSFLPNFFNLLQIGEGQPPAKIVEISTLSTSQEQTTATSILELGEQGLLHGLYLRILSMKPERLILEQSVFQGVIRSQDVVVFLSGCPIEGFEVCFLDFKSKRWLGMHRMVSDFAELRDLVPYMMGCESTVRFLLFREFLQDRTVEMPSLKAAMNERNLSYVDFSKDSVTGLLLPNGASTMTTGSREFPRLMANREISGTFLKSDLRDFDVKMMKKMGDKLKLLRNSLGKIRSADKRHLMAMGLGNYFSSSGFNGFGRFLGNVRKMVKRRSRKARH